MTNGQKKYKKLSFLYFLQIKFNSNKFLRTTHKASLNFVWSTESNKTSKRLCVVTITLKVSIFIIKNYNNFLMPMIPIFIYKL